jgi:ATP:ADP antiporter, AAA family
MFASLRLRILDLRSGERRPFLLAFLLLALTIAGHTLVETARDALFLARLPPQRLAFVYVTVAAGTLLVTPISANLVRWVGARNAIVATLVSTAYGIAWFRLRPASNELVFALYVFGGLAATALVAQFWILATELFTAAQGRRLFGPLAAGGVLGAIAGAAIATALLLAFSVQALLVAACAAFVVGALVATLIDVESDEVERVVPPALGGDALRVLREEPFVWRLAGIAAASTALAVVVDYVFKARIASSVQPGELAGYFARFQLGLNAASLVLQLLVAGPLVARLGVVGVALLTPAALLLTSSLAAAGGASLGAMVVTKGADGALRNSVHRVGLELFWAPLESATKQRAKAFVDGVVTRGAQALAAVALYFLARGSEQLTSLTVVATVLAGFWLISIVRLRVSYMELFRKALRRGDLDRDFSATELDLTAVEALIEALARPEGNDVIAAMNVLADRGRAKLIPALILYHDDERVLVRALEILASSERRDWQALGERLLEHRSSAVQQAAVRALARAGAREPLERAAESEQPLIRATAALHLAQFDQRPLSQDPRVSELVEAEGEMGHQARLALIEAIAAHPTEDSVQTLLELARRPQLEGAVTAAFTQVSDERALPFLVERLAARDDRTMARKALVRLGPPAFQELVRQLGSASTSRRLLLHLPRTLAAFETPAAVDELVALLRSSHDGLVRYKALRGLEQLALRTDLRVPFAPLAAELQRNCVEYLRLFALALPFRADSATRRRTSRSLVLGLLEDKLRQSLDRIQRLIQVTQRGDDVPRVFSALRSNDRHQHARAVEFLDALVRGWERGAGDTTSVLRLIVEELSPSERVARAAPFTGVLPKNVTDVLELLSSDPDPTLSALAFEAQRAPPLSRRRSEAPPPPPELLRGPT